MQEDKKYKSVMIGQKAGHKMTRKKKYLCGMIVLSVVVKYTILPCNNFITCSITKGIKLEIAVEDAIKEAIVEENPTYYVELNNEADEVFSQETPDVQENTETSVKPDYADYDTPPDNSFKSYMDYRTITDTTSKQYELQKQADTNWCGMRMVDNKYCIAVGSYYSTSVGQAIDVIMQNGNTINCIVADLKQDIHTDSTNRQNPNGSIVEFLVDTDILHRRIQRVGDISYIDIVWGINLFSGEIDTIRVYE